MDEDIQSHFRRKYNMSIGLRTAERIKIEVGAVDSVIENPPAPVLVKGKDMLRGIPVTRQIDHAEVAGILEKSISTIELSVIQTLEKCPPELAGDIFVNGIYITGGNALLHGLKERFEKKTRLKINIDPTPLHSVSKGMGTVLKTPKNFRGVLLS
jgi:rod shape-determining protein MreB